MNRDDAIAKIKKCLALGKSANEHEAAAAMRQAQKLMQQHELDHVDIELADVSESSCKAASNAVVLWQSNLAHLVASAFGCQHFGSRTVAIEFGQRIPMPRQYVFVGVGAAPEVAAYTFQVLSRQCAKARMQHIAKQPRNCKPITKTARGDVFAASWVHAVSDQVHAFAGSPQRTELLETYMARNHPDLISIKPKRREVGRNVRDDDAIAGFVAGKQADLRRAVSGKADQELLG